MSGRAAATANLTGVWNGLFSYPTAEEPGHFVATLLEAGPFLTGSTHEEGRYYSGETGTLIAAIDGEREGMTVYFDKTYDGSGGWNHLVRYQGVISDDWLEIEGRWQIPGEWSGRFLMIRSNSPALANARERFVRV
ncbi:MAG: hypothetical protein GC145_07455 [Caulobacter sp.]|nr:hypothetical protein [Caulobacter sp.]